MHSNNPYFVFIESNTTGTGQLFIQEARKMGLCPLFLTRDSSRYSFLKEEMLHPLILNTNQKDTILAALKNYQNIVGVFSSSDYYLQTAAYVAEKFNCISNSPDAILNCRIKDRCHQILMKSQIGVPQSIYIQNKHELPSMRDQIKFPVVVKPSMGTGSIGVKRCDNFAELELHINRLLQNATNERQQSSIPGVLIQEYIDGAEYSVETFSTGVEAHVIGITKKHLGAKPYFVEIGHDFPAVLENSLESKIRLVVIKALQALGLKYGPAHTEIRIRDNEIFIIEVNPRLAGGMIPQLIKLASGINLISKSIALFSGMQVNIEQVALQKYASIRSFIPPCSGVLEAIELNQKDAVHPEIQEVTFTGKVNENVELLGDYRDRIGYVITAANTPDETSSIADQVVKNTQITINTNASFGSIEKADTGRLKQFLRAEVLRLLNEQSVAVFSRYQELVLTTQIDVAHLIMLHRQNLVSKKNVRLLLREILQLQSTRFLALEDLPAPRGVYLMYESYIIDKLGLAVGGVLGTARSRNDLNATLCQLKIRQSLITVYQRLWELRSGLVARATQSLDIALPIYSQYQTALPGTVAHYLLAINESLARDQEGLKNLFNLVNESPLGAGAGGGTSFAIQPELTAELLGFAKYKINSLDAVASRDLVLRLYASISIIGTTISRFTEDLQLWSTNEFKFIEFPDDLTGGSSMMPQKKNPYLLEKIKAMVVSSLGDFVTSISIMNKVPFGNSVEVGTESLRDLDQAVQRMSRALTLLSIIVDAIIFIPKNVNRNIIQNQTYATLLAENLVKEKDIPFREAHYQVGSDLNNNTSYSKKLSDVKKILQQKNVHFDVNNIAFELAAAFQYGGGPGAVDKDNLHQNAAFRLMAEAEWLKAIITQYHDADEKRARIVNELIEKL